MTALQRGGRWSGDRDHRVPSVGHHHQCDRASQTHKASVAHFGALLFRNSPNLSQISDYGPHFFSV